MESKKQSPTQAMGDGNHKGEPGETRGDNLQGPQSTGGAYPNFRDRKNYRGNAPKNFKGGQSVQGYHGPRQLGDEDVADGGNKLSGSKEN